MGAKHTVNGDQQNGWYCYQCDFFTRDVTEAAAHDGVMISSRTSLKDKADEPASEFERNFKW